MKKRCIWLLLASTLLIAGCGNASDKGTTSSNDSNSPTLLNEEKISSTESEKQETEKASDKKVYKGNKISKETIVEALEKRYPGFKNEFVFDEEDEWGGYVYMPKETDPTGEMLIYCINPYNGNVYDEIGGIFLENLLIDAEIEPLRSEKTLEILKNKAFLKLDNSDELIFYENNMGDMTFAVFEGEEKVVFLVRVNPVTGDVYDGNSFEWLGNLKE